MVRGTNVIYFIISNAEAEIAINSAITTKMFGIEPKIAMLSYCLLKVPKALSVVDKVLKLL